MSDVTAEAWATALIESLSAANANKKALVATALKQVYSDLDTKTWRDPNHDTRLIVLHCVKLLQAYYENPVPGALNGIHSVDQQIDFQQNPARKPAILANPAVAALKAFLEKLNKGDAKGGRRHTRGRSRSTKSRRRSTKSRRRSTKSRRI